MDDTTSARHGPRNLELKVRCSEAELAEVRVRLGAAGTEPIALRQLDTYFTAPHGRLKLREIAGPGDERAAELIGYRRADRAGARWSDYDRVPIGPDDAPALIRALSATLGLRTVVAKTRAVALLGRTRVHLDRVDDLGCFVELETVAAPGDDHAGIESELAEIVATLGLGRFEVVAGSYAELVEALGARR
jgi:adenylate cyclase class IV